jgi:cysteine desulfurase/selenocysteine lyase
VTRVASDRGYVDPDAIRKALRRKTAMVAMTHASNVLGTVQPVEEIGPIVREAGALFLVDVAQSAGVVALDARRAEVDLLAVSGYKMLFGPTGTGALYVGPRADPRPWREGDTGGESTGEFHPPELPYRLEGGTPNVLGIAGLAAGIGWVEGEGPENLRRRIVGLLQSVVEWAEGRPGWAVAGRWVPSAHAGVLSLIPGGIRPLEVVGALDRRFGIAIRAGLRDAPAIHHALGTFPDGTLRVSPGPFNTEADIAALLDALSGIAG